jgi:HSP20 family protein
LSDLPGINKEHVQLSVEGDFIKILAWRKEKHESHRWKTHKKELNYGKVERRFSLPDDVDTQRISSTFNNGVLELIMPKKGPEQQRDVKRIRIN